MDIQAIYSDIAGEIEKQASQELAAKNKRYHKYEGHVSYGLKAATLDQIHRQYKKILRELSLEDALALAIKLYASRKEEEVLTGTYILTLHVSEFVLPSHSDYLDKVADCLVSWSTTDDFAGTVMQSLIIQQPVAIINLLRQWNTSENIWKRRTSLVAFTRKVGKSGKFTHEALEFCDNLITDKEDLIQKAIGWALKDVMRGDKKRVLEYVKKLRKSGAPAIITLYAIRDLKGKEREEILALGKKS